LIRDNIAHWSRQDAAALKNSSTANPSQDIQTKGNKHDMAV